MFKSKKAEEKKTVSKSLFSSQSALVRIEAVFENSTTETIWENPHVNSVFGHVSHRHCYEKEDKYV